MLVPNTLIHNNHDHDKVIYCRKGFKSPLFYIYFRKWSFEDELEECHGLVNKAGCSVDGCQ